MIRDNHKLANQKPSAIVIFQVGRNMQNHTRTPASVWLSDTASCHQSLISGCQVDDMGWPE